ncbi:hypothetical protein RchiOBHm_Chr6g0275421 [Rosa chinensis]|uniref:Uncharacterized protein n=1 Tax=Rosa chinensis TaxID=74649 RepID=A0A2P6PS25_ROSCH|nr:hypothetical protein RchiOBHm_Chr6g0275421 [Rosa chinensis]
MIVGRYYFWVRLYEAWIRQNSDYGVSYLYRIRIRIRYALGAYLRPSKRIIDNVASVDFVDTSWIRFDLILDTHNSSSISSLFASLTLCSLLIRDFAARSVDSVLSSPL